MFSSLKALCPLYEGYLLLVLRDDITLALTEPIRILNGGYTHE